MEGDLPVDPFICPLSCEFQIFWREEEDGASKKANRQVNKARRRDRGDAHHSLDNKDKSRCKVALLLEHLLLTEQQPLKEKEQRA